MCRSRELPDLYSHYGSRGIVVLAVLQSLAQGEGCWGEQGMRNLWDASNVKIFAGGLVRLRLARSYSPYSWERPSMKRKSLTRSPVSWSTQRHRARERRRVGRHPGGAGRRQPLGHTPGHRPDGPVDAPAQRFGSGGFACPLRRSPGAKPPPTRWRCSGEAPVSEQDDWGEMDEVKPLTTTVRPNLISLSPAAPFFGFPGKSAPIRTRRSTILRACRTTTSKRKSTFAGLATAGVRQRNLAVPERWAWPLRNPSRDLGASEVEDT